MPLQLCSWGPRRQPYTMIGIRRLACCHCGAQAERQTRCCADGRYYRPLCAVCDTQLARHAQDLISWQPPGNDFMWSWNGQDIEVSTATDLALNHLVLSYLRHPRADDLLQSYAAAIHA